MDSVGADAKPLAKFWRRATHLPGDARLRVMAVVEGACMVRWTGAAPFVIYEDDLRDNYVPEPDSPPFTAPRRPNGRKDRAARNAPVPSCGARASRSGG